MTPAKVTELSEATRYAEGVIPSSAQRRAAESRTRRTTKAVLVVGVLLAALLGVASAWVVWLGVAGIAVAALTAVVAVALAWREQVERRAEHHAHDQQVARAHTDHLRQVRDDHASVMKVLSGRNEVLRGQLRDARAEVGELQAGHSRLRGDLEALRVENADLRGRVEGSDATDAAVEVVTLPRRRATGQSVEGWLASEAETVIDLDLARLATPFVEDVVRRHAN